MPNDEEIGVVEFSYCTIHEECLPFIGRLITLPGSTMLFRVISVDTENGTGRAICTGKFLTPGPGPEFISTIH